ncbi:NAD(P)/FAD-dependent oxidoreductase [Crocosphaera sp. Alani8]|uniref:NAD(P)/FAD-dependent oxidoreductase n=1 Tax=Crocosphaera sp. Alani8 TaxID=3038952 RepID=UPI00313B1469
MSLDYDLVIIGNTLEAFFAALEAIQLKARVALVLGDNNDYSYQEVDRLIFECLIKLKQKSQFLKEFNLDFEPSLGLYLSQIERWKNEVKRDMEIDNNLEQLANLGVDVIQESGEFCRLPKLGFVLKNRTLRSRRYILARKSISVIPEIQGLAEVGYLTTERLDINQLPNRLAVVSQTPSGIELAQQLNSLGKQIVLIIKSSTILPQEDPDIEQLIQAILEAEGIKILINSSITQVKKIEDETWIQAGNEAIQIDEIIITNGIEQDTKDLNLEGVQVKVEANKIKTNERLQTTNPKIYACGQGMNSSYLSNLAQYEASVAVKNAIFFPIFKTNYEHYPMRIITNPIFSRVGLTETKARQKYNRDLIVIKENYNTLLKAKILDETTGFCKIITRTNGTILGCQIIGYQSDEIINIVALAMKNKLKIKQISQLFPPYGTASEMIAKISRQWQIQKRQNNRFINNYLETLLFWRRKWTK